MTLLGPHVSQHEVRRCSKVDHLQPATAGRNIWKGVDLIQTSIQYCVQLSKVKIIIIIIIMFCCNRKKK